MKGKKADMILDGFDSILKIAVDYINERYRITKRVEEFRKEVIHLLFRLKRHFIRSVIEAVLIGSALVALVIGAVLFANRFLPLDVVFIAYGLLVLFIVLWQIKLRP